MAGLSPRINNYIMKVKKQLHLPTILRGNWHLKVSVLNSQILVVAKHVISAEVVVQCFTNESEAENFIKFLIIKDTYEQQ